MGENREYDPYSDDDVIKVGGGLQDANDTGEPAPVHRGQRLRDMAEPHNFKGDDVFCGDCGKTRSDERHRQAG